MVKWQTTDSECLLKGSLKVASVHVTISTVNNVHNSIRSCFLSCENQKNIITSY